jgi:hypothetical protein
VYIVTAWNGSEFLIRCPDSVEALQHARDLVSRGKKISIVRTTSGEPIAVNELEAEARIAGTGQKLPPVTDAIKNARKRGDGDSLENRKAPFPLGEDEAKPKKSGDDA